MEAASHSKPNAVSSRLPALEGLRGIAAIMVVVSHLCAFAPSFAGFLRESVADFHPLIQRVLIGSVEWIYDGHYAVWVFWVMSAIVLSLRYFLYQSESQHAKAQRYLYGAAIRRYPRLVIPIFASVMIAYLLHVCGLMQNQTATQLFPSEALKDWYQFSPDLGFAFYESFFKAFYQHDFSHTYNGVLWTMHAELIGSMFIFIVLGIVGKYRWRWIAYLCLAIVLLITHYDYLNGFLCGIMMCDLYVQFARQNRFPPTEGYPLLERLRQSGWFSLVVLMVVLILVGQPNDPQRLNIVMSVITCVLVLSLPPLNRWLSTRLPVFLGRISFGVYLTHHLLICSYSSLLYIRFLQSYSEWQVFVIISLLTLPPILLVGWLFHRLVDENAIRWSKWLQDWAMKARGS